MDQLLTTIVSTLIRSNNNPSHNRGYSTNTTKRSTGSTSVHRMSSKKRGENDK